MICRDCNIITIKFRDCNIITIKLMICRDCIMYYYIS